MRKYSELNSILRETFENLIQKLLRHFGDLQIQLYFYLLNSSIEAKNSAIQTQSLGIILNINETVHLTNQSAYEATAKIR